MSFEECLCKFGRRIFKTENRCCLTDFLAKNNKAFCIRFYHIIRNKACIRFTFNGKVFCTSANQNIKVRIPMFQSIGKFLS